MGKQPAVLIVARHGTRLDQANKEWSSTAEEPWNTPLSYGGWIQSQNLGARIATELQHLEKSSEVVNDGAKDNTTTNPRPPKRRKVTIHSSPYLRCIQTSIGIAAGLKYPQEVPRLRPIPAPFQRSSLSRPPLTADQATSPPGDETGPNSASTASRPETALTELKIDSWLGEWLSSGYFDTTQPPPPTEELARVAKAALKRPPDEIKGADLSNSIQEFDEVDWTEKPKDPKDVKAIPIFEKTGLRAMAARGHGTMPRRSRTVSLSTAGSMNGIAPASEPVGRRPRSTTYSPPVPTYSIAPQDTIPIGFVAHARDACMDPDFEWDSEKAPLNWGDGGQYEEEWSTMHRRFGKGLQNLLSYYEANEPDYMDVDDAEAEEELVVILVTHQAGCNALIRILTGAPALHDVGTASLTLATRKSGLTRQESAQSSHSPSRRRRGSLDLGIDDDFDMKIIASTEHLRAGSNPLGLNSPRLGMSPAFASRRMAGADSVEGFSIGDPLAWRSSSQTTIGRSSSLRSHAGGSASTESLSGTGLWSTRDARSSSISSDISVDPYSTPIATPRMSSSTINSSVIVEDEAENLLHASPSSLQGEFSATFTSLEGQSIWQPTSAPKRVPVRSNSTRLATNPMTGTGLWGSPVINSGGVKEGTPHSRGSFGLSDANKPTIGPRSSGQRISWQQFGATREEDESVT